MNLMTELPKIAAKELKNTHFVPKRMKDKIDLLKACYSSAAIVRDFTEWCREHKDDRLQYPILDYLHEVDSRLGSGPELANMRDPNIEVIAALAYEYTGSLAPKKAIADLLLTYTVDEIRDALIEYAENLTEKETPGAIRRFFSDGGAGAVILTRRKRAQHGRQTNDSK